MLQQHTQQAMISKQNPSDLSVKIINRNTYRVRRDKHLKTIIFHKLRVPSSLFDPSGKLRNQFSNEETHVC